MPQTKNFLRHILPLRLRAVSLPETIIAITLFSIIAGISIQFLDQLGKGQKKTEMQEYVAEEAWRVLEELGGAIKTSVVDYEEYYSREVYQPLYSMPTPYTFGENYGAYHATFFHPSSGYDTGAHPYGGSGFDPEEANAFCPTAGLGDPNCATDNDLHARDELFLINAEGTRRTYFVVENNTLSKVELVGSDTDQDSLIDTWACAPEYTCTGAFSSTGTLPNPADLTDGVADDNNFVRLTPSNLFVENLTFFISPLEDPFKGFNETAAAFESVQQQPVVTVVLEARYQLYDGNGDPIPVTAVNQYMGPAAETQVQGTFSTGVFNVIPTYEP